MKMKGNEKPIEQHFSFDLYEDRLSTSNLKFAELKFRCQRFAVCFLRDSHVFQVRKPESNPRCGPASGADRIRGKNSLNAVLIYCLLVSKTE